jgi:hypothetical protein
VVIFEVGELVVAFEIDDEMAILKKERVVRRRFRESGACSGDLAETMFRMLKTL